MSPVIAEPFSHFAADWATVAVAVLAAVAILKTLWDDSKRRIEREEDRREREDVAYATVHAEYFRIWTVSEYWRRSDLTDPGTVATMSPDDILPRDWASLTHNLAQLGYLPADIGGFALALAHDANRQARALFQEVMAYQQMRPNDARGAREYDEKHKPRLKEAETTLKKSASDAANTLEDALAHAAPAKRVRYPVWNDVLHSDYTRKMKAEIEAKQKGLVTGGTGDQPKTPQS